MRTSQKTPSVWAIFYPKRQIKNKVKERERKATQPPRWAKFGRNAERTTSRELSIFAGSKIKQVKESGSQTPPTQLTADGKRRPYKEFRHFCYPEKVWVGFRTMGSVGGVNIKNTPFIKQKYGVTIGVNTKIR